MGKSETLFIEDYYIEKEFLQMVYNEVKDTIATENRIEARRIQRKRDAKRNAEAERRRYFCNQKFLGGIWCVLILLLTLLIGDPVVLTLMIPGIAIISTKKMVIVNEYWKRNGGMEQWLIEDLEMRL